MQVGYELVTSTICKSQRQLGEMSNYPLSPLPFQNQPTDFRTSNALK